MASTSVSSVARPAVIHHLAQIIRERRDQIVERWKQDARALPRARTLADPILVDHIPQLLESITRMAERLGEGDASFAPNETDVEGHALLRLQVGFEVREVLAELHALRTCILLECADAGVDSLAVEEQCVLHAAIDDAIAASVARYTELRARALRGFDRIASAGAQSGRLDELLQRLLHALHEMAPAIDASAIFIREDDTLVLRAAAGLDRAAELGRLRIRVGDGFAGRVASTESAQSIQHPGAADLRSTMLADAKPAVLHGWPLFDGDRVIAVTEIASLGTDHLSEQDLQLVEGMVARAASLIRKQLLRDALAERQQRLEALGDTIPQLAWIRDREGNALWFNRRWLEYTGLSDGQLAKALRTLHRPDYQECFDAAWSRALATGQPVEELLPLYGADGYCRWFLMHAAPIGGAERWVATYTDVTERRFLDVATRVLHSSLDHRETLERVARLVVPDLADWCIVDLLEDGRLQHVAVVHDHPVKLALARDLMTRYPPRQSDMSWQIVRSGEAMRIENIAEDTLLRTVDNPDHARALREIGFHSWIGAPLVARGQAIGVIHLIMSGSGRRYTKEHLDLARELGDRAGIAVDNARLYRDAQSSIRIREDVLAIVSHDLRNPLGAIELGTTLLGEQLGDNARAHKQLETIRRSTDRMKGLIGDLLDMASINSGKVSLSTIQLDAAELVDDVLEQHRPFANKRGVTLRRDCDVSGIALTADRNRLTQVFGNLLGNAIKFCKQGDVITLGCTRDGERVRFVVSDTGPGIPRAELPHIFEPYWVGRTGKQHGTGLGLFITKAIVEAHGGEIEATSEEGRGATFALTLPIAAG